MISRYDRGDVTPNILAASIKKLQVAFPSMGADFFNLLTERIIANGFTDERLQDAVAKVIDTFQYRELHVSDVVKFDRHQVIHAHQGMHAYNREGTQLRRLPDQGGWGSQILG